MSAVPKPKPEVFYPSSDGKPMADNTRQLQWIIVLVTNLEALFSRSPDVFVGGNQNWYPVQGEPGIVQAPDAYVVFGRPKGHRESYKQWEEGDVPMTVVFEVLSPSNDHAEMTDKFLFYDEYGVQEYYVYDPLKNRFFAYLRGAATLVTQKKAPRFTSPRLGVTFDLTGDEMVVSYPDGRRFKTITEITEDVERLETARRQAEQRAAQADQRIARMAFLVQRVLAGQATPEEAQELQQLSQAAAT